MRDLILSALAVLAIVVGFYAFQLLVLFTVGLAIYWSAPYIRKINNAIKGK